MSSGSISEMTMKATVPGKGQITAKIYKHLAPVTLAKILRALPMDGRVNMFESNFAYFITGVVTGEEKSRRDFKKGEIAFLPGGSMMCFFLQDTKSQKPMNPLGELSSGLEILQKCRRGDSIRIDSIEPSSSSR